jgi:DNA repair protein SbcC/Rad50
MKMALAELVAGLKEKLSERDSLAGRVQQAQESSDKEQINFAKLEKRAAEDADRQRVVAELRILRQAFAKDGLPTMYLRERFKRLTEVTQTQLARLGANFIIRQDPEDPTGFEFRRLDEVGEYWMKQNKLSGGQRVRFTVAFLLAVQNLVIPDVGFLVLDEPSLHLDEEGVDSLKELFTTLQAIFGNSESQILVCDHRPELFSSFSNSLNLTKN